MEYSSLGEMHIYLENLVVILNLQNQILVQYQEPDGASHTKVVILKATALSLHMLNCQKLLKLATRVNKMAVVRSR